MSRPDLPADPVERARAKADLLVQAARRPAFSIEDPTFRVQVRSEPYRDGTGALVVNNVRVMVNGQQVDVSETLPWRFVNPPLLVPDPNGDIEVTDDEGQVVRRMRHDTNEAFRRMLLDTARRVVG